MLIVLQTHHYICHHMAKITCGSDKSKNAFPVSVWAPGDLQVDLDDQEINGGNRSDLIGCLAGWRCFEPCFVRWPCRHWNLLKVTQSKVTTAAAASEETKYRCFTVIVKFSGGVIGMFYQIIIIIRIVSGGCDWRIDVPPSSLSFFFSLKQTHLTCRCGMKAVFLISLILSVIWFLSVCLSTFPSVTNCKITGAIIYCNLFFHCCLFPPLFLCDSTSCCALFMQNLSNMIAALAFSISMQPRWPL